MGLFAVHGDELNSFLLSSPDKTSHSQVAEENGSENGGKFNLFYFIPGRQQRQVFLEGNNVELLVRGRSEIWTRHSNSRRDIIDGFKQHEICFK